MTGPRSDRVNYLMKFISPARSVTLQSVVAFYRAEKHAGFSPYHPIMRRHIRIRSRTSRRKCIIPDRQVLQTALARNRFSRVVATLSLRPCSIKILRLSCCYCVTASCISRGGSRFVYSYLLTGVAGHLTNSRPATPVGQNVDRVALAKPVWWPLQRKRTFAVKEKRKKVSVSWASVSEDETHLPTYSHTDHLFPHRHESLGR